MRGVAAISLLYLGLLLSGLAGRELLAQEAEPARPVDIRPVTTRSAESQTAKPRDPQRTTRTRNAAAQKVDPKPRTDTPAPVAKTVPAPPQSDRPKDVSDSKPTSPADVDERLVALAAGYCSTFGNEAESAQRERQIARMAELESRLQTRIAELDARRIEVQKAIERQESLRKKSDEAMVAIFSRMRAEAAAMQLSSMDETTAASVLARLNPRTASNILNEINPAKAARIADAMGSSGPR